MNKILRAKKHILFISGSHVWSMGAGRGASSFYQTLYHYAEAGWDVDLIIGNNADGAQIGGVTIHNWNPTLFSQFDNIRYIGAIAKVLYISIFTIFSVAKALLIHRRRKISLIYAYEIHGVFAGWILKTLLGVSVVSRFQGTVLYPLMKAKFWRLRYWDHFLAFRAPVDLVIMANDGTLGDVVLDRIRQGANCRFWINGVNVRLLSDFEIESIRAAYAMSRPSKYRILAVSRLVDWKRVDRVINAMPEVVRSLPNVEFQIVGEGPEMEALKRLVNEKHLANHVQFLGAKRQDEVFLYMIQSDLFVSMFDLSNVGNPLLEAMTVGSAIVALNTGGTSSIIEDGKNGVLIDPEQIETLPGVLTELLADGDRRKKLGSNAREYARKNFLDWRRRMKMEIDEVEELI